MYTSYLQLIHNITGQAPAEKTTIVICGITKLFVGELIEAGDAQENFPMPELPSDRGLQNSPSNIVLLVFK